MLPTGRAITGDPHATAPIIDKTAAQRKTTRRIRSSIPRLTGSCIDCPTAASHIPPLAPDQTSISPQHSSGRTDTLMRHHWTIFLYAPSPAYKSRERPRLQLKAADCELWAGIEPVAILITMRRRAANCAQLDSEASTNLGLSRAQTRERHTRRSVGEHLADEHSRGVWRQGRRGNSRAHDRKMASAPAVAMVRGGIVIGS